MIPSLMRRYISTFRGNIIRNTIMYDTMFYKGGMVVGSHFDVPNIRPDRYRYPMMTEPCFIFITISSDTTMVPCLGMWLPIDISAFFFFFLRYLGLSTGVQKGRLHYSWRRRAIYLLSNTAWMHLIPEPPLVTELSYYPLPRIRTFSWRDACYTTEQNSPSMTGNEKQPGCCKNCTLITAISLMILTMGKLPLLSLRYSIAGAGSACFARLRNSSCNQGMWSGEINIWSPGIRSISSGQ